ncbi:histidine phosphatase family protein [Paraburkholderia graminis]|uniref:histidine phosphatase family protein n=1 Tax=Paraburkholderia graminis TaxID=60548 RepID=UPI000DEF6042|nr:histidine phosphatase family protein [Paraburkholderia graminis]AXF10068.1 histidine phosphatase family protein [Paraburkholderia graminis]MDR6472416.1 broad specificity phosphatase PhoE [Paraburkholderia graminis]
MNLRLLLISHAPTAAMRAGRFPADDPLDARGLADAQAAQARLSHLSHLAAFNEAPAFVSPAVCARDTASALGLNAKVDAALADIDYGNWKGRRLADLAAQTPIDLTAWMHDPDAAPHGGESFGQAVKRIGEWLDTLDVAQSNARDVIAVTHAAIIRAAVIHALAASSAIFPRIEIAPLTVVELHRSEQRGWTWWPASS